MDFTVDVILVEQPLRAATCELAQDGTGCAGNEREHTACTELPDVERRRPGRLAQVSRVCQVTLQRTHQGNLSSMMSLLVSDRADD
jgi:hypothetical protein